MFFKIVVGLLILLCLIGNTYIISSVLLNKNLRNWIGYHVLSIVIVDFVTEAFFKSSAVLMLMQQNTFGDYLCYPIYIALRSSQTIILLNLLIVLFWINVACYEKMRVLNITSNSRTILTIVALWIGTITYVTYEKLKPHSELNLKSCRDDNKLLFTYVVNIAIALILIAFYVSLISLKIFRKASRTVRSQAIYSNISMELLPISEEDECNDKRMVRTIHAISILFFISWIPYLLGFIPNRNIDPNHNTNHESYMFLLGFLRSVFNPFICFCVNPEFRVLLNNLRVK